MDILDQIKTKIREDWKGDPQEKICLLILTYLTQSENLLHLTFSSLAQVSGNTYKQDQILDSIQYLCGDRVHLLDVNFELIQDDDEPVDIDQEYLSIAESTGKLIHPKTGEEVANFKDDVYIYFRPSNLVRTIQVSN